MSVADIGALNNNLLSLDDSGFESGIGTWAAGTNASALAQSSAWAFTGTRSLGWTATAAGDTKVATGSYVVSTGDPYIASLVVKPAVSRTVVLGLSWLNGGSFLSFQSVSVVVPASGGPLALAGVAPATANRVQVFVQVNGAGLSELTQIDLVYLAQSDVQVLCDWKNPAFSAASAAGSAFFDLSPFIRLDPGVSLTRGKQDAVGSVQAGSASFSAYNTPGWFTGSNSDSPWYPNVRIGRRTQINVADEAGTWHTRFDGPVFEITYDFDSVGSSYANIQCTDVLEWLQRLSGLSCWTRQQVLADGPSLHWALDDAPGSITAAESSGNNGPVLRLRKYSTPAASLSFAAGNGGVETQANAPSSSAIGIPGASPLPSAFFTTQSVHADDFAWSSSAQLSSAIPAMSTRTGSSFAIEFWATLDPAAFTGIYNAGSGWPHLLCMLGLGDTRTGKNFSLSLLPSSAPDPTWIMQTWALPINLVPYTPLVNPASLASSQVTATPYPDGGVPVHFVANVAGNDAGATLTLYINGVSSATITLPKYFTPDWIDIGGLYGGNGGWQGNISLVSVYPGTLSGGVISAHTALGSDGLYLSSVSDGIIATAAFAGLPSFWSNLGVSTSLGISDYIDLSGQSALGTMQAFEQEELTGLLYVNAAGRLCFDGRQMRMGASSPDLTLPAGSFSPDLGYKVTGQYLATSASVNTPAATGAATVSNSSAFADYGPYPSGTPRSPESISVLSQSPKYASQGFPAYAMQLEPYVTDAAAWQANGNATPRFRPVSVTVDVATLKDPASGAYVALSALYGADLNKIVRLSGPVTAFPDGDLDYFIEGISETKTASSHLITLYTSPATIARCWKPGDATYGVLDSTAVIGVSDRMSHANGPRTKLHTADPGDPFWPPVYASAMNNGGTSGKGFVGATDQRGIWYTLQAVQRPPLLVAGQLTQQSFGSGTSGAEQTMQWDMVYVDTAGGLGLTPGFPNWYVILKSGFYEIHCVVVFTANATGNRFARLLINPAGGTANTPPGSSALSVASTSKRPIAGTPTPVTLSTRLYCGVGTTIGVRAWQDSGGTLLTGVSTANGSLLSVRFTGYSATAD